MNSAAAAVVCGAVQMLLVMDDSEISILDLIRFEKNLDFELRAIFTVLVD